VKLKSDYLLALIIQIGGTLVSALACTLLIFIQKIIEFYLPRFNDIKSTIVEGWYIFISGVGTNIYTATNTVILGFLTDGAAVGIFSASEKIVRAIISLFSSVTQVTFPRINSYYRESRDKAIKFGGKLLWYSGIITFFSGVLLLLFAPLIVRILFGMPQYYETINIIRISSFLPFFAVCNGILGVNLLITFELKQYLVKIVGMGCVFSLLVIAPAVIIYQAKGVAIVAILTEILITFLFFNVLRKHKIELEIVNFTNIGKF
jgi:polysaccharide transporter, PST family